MNKLFTTAMVVLLSLTTYAQTTLPTSWSFVGSPPTGWTTVGTGFYTGSGNTPPAGRFDNTGDYLEIFFSDDPGTVEYYLTGNSFSGGTFTVEESVNGTVWTTLHTFTNPPAGTYTQYIDVPNINSRYIRFFYTLKVSGNIGVDDINITPAPAGPSQEINVTYTSTSVPTNGTVYFNSPVSTMSQKTFVIENLGTVNTLNITSAIVTGPASADFVVSTTPSTVSAASTANLVIDFTPSVAGTRNATLTIVNDDVNENPYVINLYGVGGSFATEPTAQATSMNFTNVKSYRMTVNYTAAVPAPDAGYLILRKKGSVITDAPTDGVTYTRGDQIGSSKVTMVGPGTSITPNNIIAGTDYHFAVFAYNGAGVYINYAQAAPLTGMSTSAGNMMGSYYSGVNSTQASFVTNLHNLINPHSHLFYSTYAANNIEEFSSRDTTGGNKVVTCVYSGFNDVYTPPFAFDTMSREHTLCHSWMATYPCDNPELPEYADHFNLFPTQFLNVNQVRSNYPLGEVVTITSSFMQGKLGLDINSNTVYEPRDQHKGDAARAMFYMLTCYHTVSGNNWYLPANQSQDVLKKWHWEDQPDAWEIARNDFIDSLQGNRNPFVDSVDWVCYIDFYTMVKITNPTLPCIPNAINEMETGVFGIHVFPNPTNGITTAMWKGNVSTITVYNASGQITQTVSNLKGKNQMDILLPYTGIFLLEMVGENGVRSSVRVVKE
ncbi:MAG: endonuclease [Flavobacteriales bacterium]